MRSIARSLRGPLAALALLALTAGIAFAARPTAAGRDGLAVAAGASGHTVPVAGQPSAHQPEAPDTDTPDTSEHADSATHPDNHGATVSQAAKAETPAGFRNHGAYVSSIAKGNHGQANRPADAGKPDPSPR